MSVYAISEATTHNYETLLHNTSSAVPKMNTSLNPTLQNVVSETLMHEYGTLMNDAFSTIPKMKTSVATSQQNVTPQPHEHSVSPATQEYTHPEVPQWILASVKPHYTESSSTYYGTFLKSKPKALGFVLIVAAILEIALGIGLVFTMFNISIISGIPYWGSVLYIIAGSLTIAAQTKHNLCLVKGSLSLNIISSIISCIALIVNCSDLAIHRDCYYYSYHSRNYYYNNRCEKQLVAVYVLLSFLLVINLLVFCVTLSVSIFGCRSLSHVPTNVTQVFVMQKDFMDSMTPSTVKEISQLLPSTTTIV